MRFYVSRCLGSRGKQRYSAEEALEIIFEENDEFSEDSIVSTSSVESADSSKLSSSEIESDKDDCCILTTRVN